MKKTTIGSMLLCIFLVLAAACNHSGPEKMSIKVRLSHIPSEIKIAYLDIVEPTHTTTLDTASINPSNGGFSFQLLPEKKKNLYRIRAGENNSFLLVGGDRNITVSGDYDQMGKLNISGSEASNELQQFISSLNHQNDSLVQWQKSMEHPSSSMSDSMLQAKKQQWQAGKQALLDHILNKARTTKNPVVALFALGILDNQGLESEGKPIFDGLPARFPNDSRVQEVVSSYKKKLNNQGESLAVSIGDPAPELRYPNPEGKTISLSDLKGKYVLIDFWASWCAPCREANPKLVKIYNHFKNKNFTILGVSLDSKKSHWIEAIKKDGLTWDQMSDLKGWNSVPAAEYNIEAIPDNVLVNPEGKVIARSLSQDSLRSKLNQIFSKPSEQSSL